MAPGADLFVVCKQCGSEVSPYITECPYCGNRLRRRAPKLPRAHGTEPAPRGRSRLRSALAPRRTPRARVPAPRSSAWAGSPPRATIVIVAASVGLWVAAHAWPPLTGKLLVFGPLEGQWWRLLGYQLVYASGLYAFVAITTIALFGWLLERRHGPLWVTGLFLAAGVAGALVSLAVYRLAFLTGANAGALALLAAWAAPDLRAARAGEHYEGDLLGCAVIAAVLLAMPFLIGAQFSIVGAHQTLSVDADGAGWLAGVTGAAIGLVLGAGLHRFAEAEL